MLVVSSRASPHRPGFAWVDLCIAWCQFTFLIVVHRCCCWPPMSEFMTDVGQSSALNSCRDCFLLHELVIGHQPYTGFVEGPQSPHEKSAVEPVKLFFFVVASGPMSGRYRRESTGRRCWRSKHNFLMNKFMLIIRWWSLLKSFSASRLWFFSSWSMLTKELKTFNYLTVP